ncbi:histidine kinase [Teratosphaeria nubilosa]|uniref:Histidine kinase n=1 Tax=Teratosphaeria nubilosa TaxID=161662 RepID=A0A6G1LIJ9_9PEZI|nr:histidine kinase [Teratosphaeria nubilosa]
MIQHDEQGGHDWTRYVVRGLSDWVEYVREFNWGCTPVGPMESWSSELRQAVMGIMNNPKPRVLLWGKEHYTFIHNEASAPLFGKKHPDCLGQDASVVFAELWSEIQPAVASVFAGKTFTAERMQLPMERQDFIETTFWDFSLLPVLGHDGTVVGLLDELFEATQLVRGARRRDAIVRISEAIRPARTLQQLWPNILKGCDQAVDDIPFVELYSVEDMDTMAESASSSSPNLSPKQAVCQGTVRLPKGCGTVARTFKLEDDESHPGILKSCVQAWRERRQVMLSLKDGTLPLELANSQGTDRRSQVRRALVKPLLSLPGETDQNVVGILVVGLCCKCPFDEEYSLWTHLLGEILEKAATLISLPEERRRAQKIADEIHDALTQQLRLTTLEAEKSEARFKRMAESSPTGIFRFDADGKPLHVNDAYLDMLGDTREGNAKRRPVADTLSDRVHPEDLDRFIGVWTSVREDKAPVTIEYRLRRPWKSIDRATGQELNGDFWLLAVAYPEIEPDGTVSSVQGWLTDISHRKFLESLAVQRLEDALENKRQTENFIDMTSHEMRNPLSAILQSADSIVSTLQTEMTILGENVSLSQETADEILDASQTIILCAQHQKRITDDILTLSKLDASLLTIAPDTVQPPTLVSKALKMYEGEISRAGISAKMCVEPSYAELAVDWVVLDSSRFLQVVINLLTNAIKFTQFSDKREIRISLGASYQTPSGQHHKVKFIDPRPARPIHTERAEWGDGEELYLQVAVSDTGRGLSEEEMKLLFQRFQQASPKTYKQYGGSGLGLFISRELCELQGGQIGVCSCEGKTVLTFFVKAKRHQPGANRRPSMHSCASASASPTVHDRGGSTILMDATNGNKDSYQAADLPKFGLQPVLKAPVNGTSGTEMTANVPPISKANITRTTSGNLDVLIVEDNAINQKIMAQQLRKAGCTVHVANHGLECLNFLDQSVFCGSTTPLSVVLLDLEMPTMDGLTCIRHIREYQRTGKIVSHVPVIAVTANARSEQISVALAAGMDQVVTKPFRIPELMPQMRGLVKEVERMEGG